MKKLSCAIVEDDAISLKIIESMAEKTGMLTIEGAFTSPIEAARWLSTKEVDLLFLDMEMPNLNGLDLLRSLPKKPFVIVISGTSSFAVDAFEVSVSDYLLKPVKDYGRFLQAVTKVASQLNASEKNRTMEEGSIFVKIDSLLQKVNIADILWIEASGDYIKIQTSEKNHIVYSTLKKIEEKLPIQQFVRIHRSFIVNITKISNIDATNLEINKKVFPISSSYKEELLNKIKVL